MSCVKKNTSFNHFILISTEFTDDQLQKKETQEELERWKTLLAQKEKDLLKEKMQTHQARYPLTPETINNSSVPNYFSNTALGSLDEFNNLCRFFILTDNETVPHNTHPLEIS